MLYHQKVQTHFIGSLFKVIKSHKLGDSESMIPKEGRTKIVLIMSSRRSQKRVKKCKKGLFIIKDFVRPLTLWYY